MNFRNKCQAFNTATTMERHSRLATSNKTPTSFRTFTLSTHNFAKLLLSNILLILLATSINCQQQQDNSLVNKILANNNVPSELQASSSATGECGAHHLCQNGGTCVEGANNYTCACPAGFSGPYCGQDVNECARRPNICQNGATCLNKPGGYQCICVNGWTGHDCSENVDDCSTAACEAGATCRDLVGRFQCDCPPGRTGIRCHLDDQCVTKNPCHINATCDTSFTDGQAICTCPAGFTGSDCSIDNDECAAGSPCEHGGTCINTPGSFMCQCPRGFSGSRCEVNINECESSPCMNDGTCLDEKGGYKCICMPGFMGQNCQVDIDECASNPCQNAAICKDHINSFRCLCQTGYWGERCEFPVNQPESSSPADYLPANHPWSRCSNPFVCWTAFMDGKCDEECNTAECLYDGSDCSPKMADNKLLPRPTVPTNSRSSCDDKADSYCLRNYANSICDQECNNAECGWDGADCEESFTSNELLSYSTRAQGMLVIRVEPAISLGATLESGNIELSRLLRKVSVKTNTILKIKTYRQVDNGRGTEMELIADNRKCVASCYNNTELIANFLSALKTRTNDFDPIHTSALKFIGVDSKPADNRQNGQSVWTSYYVVCCASLIGVAALGMVINVNGKQKVKEKATIWFPEGFKQTVTSRNRDPTDRKPGRGVSTLQALGGNFFRGLKRNERNISTNPNGLHSTDIDRCATSTPNGGGIYHEPYDQYDQYGNYNGTDSGSMVNNVDEPMTPPSMPMNPINLEGPHGLTPLMVASMGTQFSKEPLGLVAYGTTGEINGNTDNNVTDLLQRGAQLNLANKVSGETALHLAARHRRVDAARSLLERCDSSDVNAQDAKGRTPLHAAIAADSLGVFQLLIRCRGTDLNAQTHDGTTPLILATKLGIYSMLEELIQTECEVTKSDANGKTALHWAAVTDNVDAIRRLLQVKETNKDAQDLLEETPLFLAAREGARGAVEILLNHNANKDISDQMDKTPIEIARLKQHHDIVRLLEQHEPQTPRSINSMHHSSRQMSPFSPIADSNSNSNSSNVPPPPSYHAHTQSGGGRQGGRQAQKAALARSSSTKPLIAEANIIRNNLQNHCKSVMVIKEVKDINECSSNTRETKTLGRRATQSTSSSRQAIQPSMQMGPFSALSANNVVMPATPNSLTNSLSPVSSSMMSPPTSSLHHLNSPTKLNPPININQTHRHNSQSNHVQLSAYDEYPPYWTNNNNPNMINVNNNVMDKTHGISEVYNAPCLKNYMTPSPDSPFSLDSMASPPGAYTDQQYQNPNHPSLTSQKQVYI